MEMILLKVCNMAIRLEAALGLQEVNHGRKGNEGWRISIGSGSQGFII
jgi:hypothetical protein